MSQVIHILFLETSADESNLVNYATSVYGKMLHGKGIHHVELCIPDDPSCSHFISSSIYAGETVSYNKVKTFANPNYIVISKLVSHGELEEIKRFVVQSHRNMVEFDGLGMYMASMPFPVCGRSSSSTFCSKYVTEALQAADLECVRGLDACITSPSKLFRVIKTFKDSRDVYGSVESKQKSISACRKTFL